MSLSRIYCPENLNVSAELQLDQRASHYLAHVLRVKPGIKIILFNGKENGEYQAVVTRILKHHVEVTIDFFLPRDAESPIDICLAQGIARGEKMDFIIQKAVELGVKKIVPLVTERCNVRLDAQRKQTKLEHWRSVGISACEQSGRNRLAEVSQPCDFSSWLVNAQSEACFVLSPHTDTRLDQKSFTDTQSFLLFIGPEGGLSPAEVNQAIERGFKPLNLGPRILRTETASIAAITFLQTLFGDMG